MVVHIITLINRSVGEKDFFFGISSGLDGITWYEIIGVGHVLHII